MPEEFDENIFYLISKRRNLIFKLFRLYGLINAYYLCFLSCNKCVSHDMHDLAHMRVVIGLYA